MNIVGTIIAGITGTLLMSVLMTFVNHVGWARADMIRALGSIVTGSEDKSVAPGLLIHFGSGILFAFPYVFILGSINVHSVAGVIGIGGLMGFVHGFAMSFVLVAAVAEKHPVPRFQEAGFEVAAAHVLGHVGYGVGVATVAALMGLDFGYQF